MSEYQTICVSKFDLLKRWIVSNGGFVHDAIGVDEKNPGNRVLIAKDEIEENTMICDIPKELCLLKNPDLIVNPNFSTFENDIHLVTILHKEFQLGSKSFYYPFLSYLPERDEFRHHPIYVAFKNPEKLNEWKEICNFSGLIDIRLTNLKFVKLYLDKIAKIDISADDLIYYNLLIMTRCWGNVGFVPFADLFQSRQSSIMFLANNADHTRHNLRVDRKYSVNDIIWINYGIYDDSILYTTFGFIDDIDEVASIHRSMRISLPKNVDKEAELKKFIEKELLEYKTNNLFISTLGISNGIFEYLRIVNLTQKEYESINKDELYMKNIISIENEIRVYQNLFTIMINYYVFPSKEIVSRAKKILEDITGEERYSSIEYHLAKLTMIQKIIFKSAFTKLVTAWIDILGVPSGIEITFKNHHLLDD